MDAFNTDIFVALMGVPASSSCSAAASASAKTTLLSSLPVQMHASTDDAGATLCFGPVSAEPAAIDGTHGASRAGVSSTRAPYIASSNSLIFASRPLPLAAHAHVPSRYPNEPFDLPIQSFTKECEPLLLVRQDFSRAIVTVA
uniref:Uncharacterized protein n=1 Tax=Mycena chlorophos TaxID=658473 RepID=A0ABQ0L1W6_MYCCL|nr:predicted protein [Mycena chlorophos]